MHILYERCAFVDVGQDIIAVAVWVPGEGPDGRKTIKRTLCARRSPICSGRWKGAWTGSYTHLRTQETVLD
ncbi:hypothetical protein, partial [Mycobacterium tuberculosis]|uniref:hypothetical protein n=1 Tax=Mycobacterium tuberculosis TaxID=1773 RepID=UPI000C070E25